jgi:hypothetical protein
LSALAIALVVVWIASGSHNEDTPSGADPRDVGLPGSERTTTQVAPLHPSMPAMTASRATADAPPAEPTRTARRRSARKITHSIDPCEPVEISEIPDGFGKLAALGITVAWDPEVTVEATTIAYTTAGLLAQLALVTGTTARSELTVIVYASPDDYHAKTGAPAWSAGLYDGAVRLPPAPRQDTGVEQRTLRHEVVHAQLHAAVGCTPIWLDEGLAQWFENQTPDREWLRMLHDRKGLDLAAMSASTLEDVHAERPEQVYAQSLAMVLYAFDRGDNLEALLHDKRGPPLDLWGRRYPEASDVDVLGSLARRVFGVALGPELDAIFERGVCCRTGSLVDFACHAAPRRDAHEVCRSAL